MSEAIVIGGVLYHHGILGQKWGKQNGPPYPLDEGDHSAREKKLMKEAKSGARIRNSAAQAGKYKLRSAKEQLKSEKARTKYEQNRRRHALETSVNRTKSKTDEEKDRRQNKLDTSYTKKQEKLQTKIDKSEAKSLDYEDRYYKQQEKTEKMVIRHLKKYGNRALNTEHSGYNIIDAKTRKKINKAMSKVAKQKMIQRKTQNLVDKAI